MGDGLLKEDRERCDGSAYIYWSIGSASGEAWTDAEAWEAIARALCVERDTAIQQKVAAEKEAARWMRITEQLREDTERAVEVSRGSASRVWRVL
jgi:hypothetical protein